MARPMKLYPSYRLHKPTGQAIVQLGDRMVYLGEFDSEVSQLEYDRVLREWVAQGRPRMMRDPGTDDGPTVNDLVLAYWAHCQTYYVKDGKPTDEQACIRTAVKPVREMYGRSCAADFTPLCLKACREQMIVAGWCRKHINKQVSRIRHMFKWGVAEGLVSVLVYQALTTLDGLKKGRTEARETSPVQPVADDVVDDTLVELDATLRAMIRLQRLTGMRPQEVCLLTPDQVDRSASVWLYYPDRHKTEHHDRSRVVPIGPRAQEILTPFLLRAADAYCFQPTRSYREHYTKDSYRERIWKACRRAFPAPKELSEGESANWDKQHRWSPNQLRHSAGTEIRKQFGLEAASTVLGHSQMSTTEIYAERDLTLAVRVAGEVG